jgi:hypothetical protein
MIQSAETRLDVTTLVVRIPMRFQHRGGRKRIVAPDGSAIVPATRPQPDGTLKALACAHRWQQKLEKGEYGRWPSFRRAHQQRGRLAPSTRDSPDRIGKSLKRQEHQPNHRRYGQRAGDDCPSLQSRSLRWPHHGP